jgi:hypothetical protein
MTATGDNFTRVHSDSGSSHLGLQKELTDTTVQLAAIPTRIPPTRTGEDVDDAL